MLKKILVVVCLITMFTIPVLAADTYGGYNIPVDIVVNGNFIKCAEKPIMINNTTYIPLRAFSDAIGGSITWDPKTNAATMKKNGHSFVFYTETNNCVIDGIKKNYKSVMYKDLTFVPVRAISDVLGYKVQWDDIYLIVKITASNVEVPSNCKDKSYSLDDITYLSRMVQKESGYQSFKAKLGVAGTIMNRVKSSQFPNTVKDVIFDTKYGVQFPPAHTESFMSTQPSKESVIAAKCALRGVNVVRNSLYFVDAKNAPKSWAHKNRTFYTTINGMSFYE